MDSRKVGKAETIRPVRASRRRLLATGVTVAVVVAALVGYWAYRAAADLPGVKLADQGNAHIQLATEPHVPYNSDPPTSGPHLPYIAPWGVHTEPIVRELQVHNLEDGGVMVQYHCATPCPDLVARLTEGEGRVGFLDLFAIPPGTPAFRTGLLHISLNLAVTAAYVVNFLWRDDSGAVPTGQIVLSSVSFLTLSFSGSACSWCSQPTGTDANASFT